MFEQLRRSCSSVLVAGTAVVLLVAVPALAQQAAFGTDGGFSKLQEKLRAGDKVTVTDTAGREDRLGARVSVSF
jgi:hypothetical protein